MLVHINMIEVPGTSFEAKDPPSVAQFTSLLAKKTAPIFLAEPTGEGHAFSEVIAVTYRGEDGAPVHGGLFGVSAEGVVSMALKDCEGKVDTSEDPAHVALGLIMMRGPLVFRQNNADQEISISIIDLHFDRVNDPLAASTPAREAVKKVYLAEVLPSADVVQPSCAKESKVHQAPQCSPSPGR